MKRLIAIAATLLLPSTALAGGIEIPDLGTKALGRGSAFTARADDLTAFYYNAAGLSKSKGINVLVVGGAVNMNMDFQRQGSGGHSCFEFSSADCDPDDRFSFAHFDPAVDPNTGERYELVENTVPIAPAPMVVVNWGDVGGVDGLAIAVGLQPPSAFGSAAYDEDSAARYSLRSSDSLSFQVGAGASYRVNRYFSIGGTFLNAMLFGDFGRAARGAIRPTQDDDNETLEGDSGFQIKVTDTFSPVFSLGVLSNPIDQLEIGFNVRSPVVYEANGNLTLTASEDTPNAALTGTGVTLRQKSPWTVRAGVRFIHEHFDFEIDYVWEQWSHTGTCNIGNEAVLARTDDGFAEMEGSDRQTCGPGLELDFDDDAAVMLPTGDVPLLDFMIWKNYRDTHSIRVGSDLEVVPKKLAIRLGGWWQSSAFPENYETFNVDFPVAQQFALTTGLTWKAIERKKKHPHKQDNWLDISAGYSHVFQPTVIVTEGIMTQRGMTDITTPLAGNVVNNGIFDVNYNLFGVSAEAHF
jgi:long-subunit fatty acid transport protein